MLPLCVCMELRYWYPSTFYAVYSEQVTVRIFAERIPYERRFIINCHWQFLQAFVMVIFKGWLHLHQKIIIEQKRDAHWNWKQKKTSAYERFIITSPHSGYTIKRTNDLKTSLNSLEYWWTFYLLFTCHSFSVYMNSISGKCQHVVGSFIITKTSKFF